MALEAPFFEVDADLALKGADVFGQCSFCHGTAAVAGGSAPDLRASALTLSEEAFANVVRDGGRRVLGMPSGSTTSPMLSCRRCNTTSGNRQSCSFRPRGAPIPAGN